MSECHPLFCASFTLSIADIIHLCSFVADRSEGREGKGTKGRGGNKGKG